MKFMKNEHYWRQYNILPTKTPKKIIVGMSGGVDSSVAALILQAMGHEVCGLFMKNWDDDQYCQSSKDFQDVVAVCETLEIPYYTLNLSEDYAQKVFQNFIEDYKQGLTPNPDILCNREIKFDVFFSYAKQLEADFLATGHYCKTNSHGILSQAQDPAKDQSYFLAQTKGEVLKEVLFPLGDLYKNQVRQIALDHGLVNARKKDSTGICFIGERPFRQFLSTYLPSQKGFIKDYDSQQIVGEHEGSAYYTIGQRKGLGIGGPGEPWFVVDKDVKENILWVVRGDNHPALYHQRFRGDVFHWINHDQFFHEKEDYQSKGLICEVKIRYRGSSLPCLVTKDQDGTCLVTLENSARAVTLGQYAVFYLNENCLGSCRIISRF
jgi:tRNA-specific 2-thiouridylase